MQVFICCRAWAEVTAENLCTVSPSTSSRSPQPPRKATNYARADKGVRQLAMFTTLDDGLGPPQHCNSQVNNSNSDAGAYGSVDVDSVGAGDGDVVVGDIDPSSDDGDGVVANGEETKVNRVPIGRSRDNLEANGGKELVCSDGKPQPSHGVLIAHSDGCRPTDAGMTISQVEKRIHKLAMFTTLDDVLSEDKPQPKSTAGRRMRPLTAGELWASMVPKVIATVLMRKTLRQSQVNRIRLKMMVRESRALWQSFKLRCYWHKPSLIGSNKLSHCNCKPFIDEYTITPDTYLRTHCNCRPPVFSRCLCERGGSLGPGSRCWLWA